MDVALGFTEVIKYYECKKQIWSWKYV